MVDAVLLDWEGVLADTRDARRVALLHALGEEGVHLDDAAYTELCEGFTSAVAAATALRLAGRTDATLADLVALRATRGFATRIGKGFVLATGAREVIEHLRINAPVGIVTAATRSETEFVLRLAGLEGSVGIIVSADDDAFEWRSGAAHREAVTRMERQRRVDPQRVVVLAQSSVALSAARFARLRTIAVSAPAHVALQADGAVDGIAGLSVTDLARIAGIASVEQRS